MVLTLDPARQDFSGRIAIALEFQRPADHLWLNAQRDRRGRGVAGGGARAPARLGIARGQGLPAGPLPLGGGTRPRPPDHRLPGQGPAPRRRRHLPGRGGGGPLPLHPVRGHRRPPRVPLLRRALVQGALAADHPHPRRPDSPSPTRRRSSDDGQRTGQPAGRRVALRRDPAAAQLPGRLRRRARSSSSTPARAAAACPLRIVVPARPRRRGAYAVEVTGAVLAQLEDYFGIALPVREARPASPCRSSTPAPWRTRASSPTQQSILLTKPGETTPDRQRRYAEHRRPRAGPPVVRQPRHHALVGRHLAERGLRHLDGRQDRRRAGSPSGTATSTGCSSRSRVMGQRQPAQRPHDPPADRDRRRHRQRVRRHHLQQGRGGARACSSAGSARTASAPACAPTWPSTPGATPPTPTSSPPSPPAAGKDVRPAFDSFVDQTGVPLVSFELDCAAGRPPVLRLAAAALPAARLEPARRPAVADPDLRPLRQRHARRGPGLHAADPGAGRSAAGRRQAAARSGCSPTRRLTATTGRCRRASCWTGCWRDRPPCCRCPNASACWATPTPWCPAATSGPSRRWPWWSGWPAIPRTGWSRRRWPSSGGSTTWCRRRCDPVTSASSSSPTGNAPGSWAGAAARARATTSRSCARICWGWWPGGQRPGAGGRGPHAGRALAAGSQGHRARAGVDRAGCGRLPRRRRPVRSAVRRRQGHPRRGQGR